MSAAAAWGLVAFSALATALIKAVGPVALGGRELPERFNGVIGLMAPALLAALVTVSVLANGKHIAVGADTVGVATAGVVLWRGGSVLLGVVVAAVVTALVRAV